MSTNFPGALDSYSVKADNVDIVQAAHINNLQDAVVALERQFSLNGNVGLAEGRLSLSSSDPVPTAAQTAKTTVYYLPYVGNRIAVYNTTTTGWDVLVFGSASVSVPATTNTPFDIFAYNNSGTLALQTVNWTNDTTRATNITRQDGIYCKSGDLGKRYLGTGRTTGVSGQTEDSETYRLLWNYYNRLDRRLYKDNYTAHTYNTGTWRAWNNNVTNSSFGLINGVREDTIVLLLNGAITRNTSTDGYPLINMGINTNSTYSFASFPGQEIQAVGAQSGAELIGATLFAAGYSYVCAIEYTAVVSTAPTFTRFTMTGIFKC